MLAIAEFFVNQQRMAIGDPQSDAALLSRRRDHHDVSQTTQFIVKCPQAGSVNSVVVGEKNLHW